MIRTLLPFLALAFLAGCAINPDEIGKAPSMSPVGAGLTTASVPINTSPTPRPVYKPGNSLWQDASANLFHDPRASRVGDIVTVKISIKDKATLDNTSNRSRKSNGNLNANLTYSANFPNLQTAGTGSFSPSADSQTSTDSEGEIKRSENIDLLVAAVVTNVLPNGNLMISGTQEVRVNYEVRILNVAGVIRPGDISTDNAVSYDKIAEARISYGGRGRISEIQQPAWGQQIVDAITPF